MAFIYRQSVQIEINPIYLMLPATVCCCYAFMLPVATPPNAIVFEAAKMKPMQLVMMFFLPPSPLILKLSQRFTAD